MQIIHDGEKYVIAKDRDLGGLTHLYLRLDGTWAQVFTNDPTCARFDTREEATAFAMGYGVVPMDFLIEQQLLDEAGEKVDLANKCLDLKMIPAIDRLLREGKRGEAVRFVTESVPQSRFEGEKLMTLLRRAYFHKPEAA